MPVSLSSCWGTLWNITGSGSASLDLGTAGPVWPTWSHFVTFLVDDRKVVDIYMEFSKILDTLSHSILTGKLAAHSLNRWSLHWVKNCILLSIFFHPWSSPNHPHFTDFDPLNTSEVLCNSEILCPALHSKTCTHGQVCQETWPASPLTPGVRCTQWSRSRSLSAPSQLWGEISTVWWLM